jgi:hypothetical protein
MKIELKNIKFSEALSQETNAFVADIYVNGQKVAYAKSDGNGGSTFYQSYQGKQTMVNEVEKYCLSLPSINNYGFEIKMDLEFKINLLFEEWLKEKEQIKFNKKLEKDSLKGICIKTDNGYSLINWKGQTIETMINHPQGIIIIKNKLKELIKDGKEILNKNIPKEFF